MNFIIFTHPDFLSSKSMPRFASMIVDGMKIRGHTVEVWTAKPFFYNLPMMKRFKKWLGYVDQFLVFPIQVRSRLKKLSRNTLFVFADQALGSWVSLVANHPHCIHVHDFMALRSSLGEFPQNPASWSGRQYQAMIRRGFNQGQNFISVSQKTQSDLHHFLSNKPHLSEVVYNGLNFPFRRMNREESIPLLSSLGLAIPPSGFLLNVGGNQWYKNRTGVLEIYEAYINQVQNPLPLWMVGAPPTDAMKAIALSCATKGDVRFLSGLSNEQVCAAYSISSLLIFPSLAEGFGWPIAEAMACGCLVLTTDEAPMTEVGGDAAFYIPKRPDPASPDWIKVTTNCVEAILSFSPEEKQRRQNLGYKQVQQFDTQQTMAAYERIYQRIVEENRR
jgi:glycosyltransferase involved in cell wall biosynthesis